MCLMESSDLPQLKTNISKFQFDQKSGEPLCKCDSYLYLLSFIYVCVVYDRYDHEFAQSEVFDYEHGHGEKQSTLQRSSGHTDSRSTHKVIHVTHNLNVLFYFLWAVL